VDQLDAYPPGYPDAITLDPSAVPVDVLSLVDDGPGCSVRDSFAALDLSTHGFRILVQAEWIGRRAGHSSTAATWPEVRTDLPGIAFADGSMSVVANLAGRVVGLSNLQAGEGAGGGDDLDRAWAGAVATISARFADRPIVGYEMGRTWRPRTARGSRRSDRSGCG